jgi:hypothetical protein
VAALAESTPYEMPQAIEVHGGRGDIVQIPYDGGRAALEKLSNLVQLKSLRSESFEAVGWSKCGGCAYNDRCRSKAEAERAVATIPDVDQSLARELYAQGVRSRAELLYVLTMGSICPNDHGDFALTK